MLIKILSLILLMSQSFQVYKLPLQKIPKDEVMTFIKNQLIPEIKPRQIKVYTGIDWDYLLLPSVSKFLFEDINIIDNFAPVGQVNRPGNKYEKHFICVHDTGDHNFGAFQWSEAVRKAKIGKRDYVASFQYVVGNDGYYHNIPDDEVAHHAGDGHSEEESLFGLIPTGVYLKSNQIRANEKANVEVDSEGYFTIDGERTKVKAPLNSTDNTILTTKDINDLGIYYTIKKVGKSKSEYFLGRTWYNPIFQKISNYGGNFNSIGIEACINHDTDVYFTWQRVAKLVAKLMKENSLSIDAVVQHHYFSGKNCPQTTRNAKLWDYFKSLVLAEYQMLYYRSLGYTFEFKSLNEKYLNNKGRVILKPEVPTTVHYTITVRDKKGNSSSKTFNSLLLPE